MKSLVIVLIAIALSILLAVVVVFAPSFLEPTEPLPGQVGSSATGSLAAAFDPPQEAGPRTRRAPWEDSGYTQADAFMRPITDSWSLEHIRDCYQGRGARGRRYYQQQLALERDPQKQLNVLLNLYALHLFD